MQKIKFFDRLEEIKILEKNYTDKTAKLIILYGRRRIGKSELIKHFAENKPHIYYLCDKRGTKTNAEEMARMSAEFFNDILPSVENFYDLFRYIISRHDSKNKLIIAIDEFPYLVEKDDAIPSIFQKIMDVILEDSNILLILSGSSISMMQKTTLSYNSPLYGRRASAIELLPMGFKEVLKYVKPLSIEKAIEVFAFFGNTPAYFTLFDKNSSIEHELIEKLMSKGGRLYMEPEFLLQEELRDISTYKSIMQAMVHSTKLSEIANVAGVPAKDMPKYLNVLLSLRIIKREIPITVKKSKKVHYYICDNLFKFWFYVCGNNISYLEDGKAQWVYNKYVKPNFNTITVAAFENISIQTVKISSQFTIDRIGRWWGKNPKKERGMNEEEIDIVALNDNTKNILFGECKWTNSKVDVGVYYDLRRKSELVQWHNVNRKEHFALFSKSGFTLKMIKLAKEEGVLLFDLSVIEKALKFI